jgi:hypothetical protein
MVVRCHSCDTWNFLGEEGIHHDESDYMLYMWPLESNPFFSNTNDFLKVEKHPLKE